MAAEPTLDTSYLTPVPRTPFYRDIEKTYLVGQEARRLAPEVLIPITMLAQGNDYEAIAEKLTLDRGEPLQATDIKSRLMLLRGVLRVDSNRKALEVLLDRGELSLDQLLPPDFDPSVFSKITDDRDQKIIKGILKGADYPALAFSMRTSEAEIADRVKSLKPTLGADNNFQIFVFGLGAREARKDQPDMSIFEPISSNLNAGNSDKRKEKNQTATSEVKESGAEGKKLSEGQKIVLSLFAMGYREFEIAALIGVNETASIKQALHKIRQKLGAKTVSHAIWKAANSNQITLESLVPEDFDPKVLDSLDAEETGFLANVIFTSTTKQPVSVPLQEFTSFKQRITSKLNVQRLVQAEVFQMEAMRRASGGRVVEDVVRYGAPKTSEKISIDRLKKEMHLTIDDSDVAEFKILDPRTKQLLDYHSYLRSESVLTPLQRQIVLLQSLGMRSGDISIALNISGDRLKSQVEKMPEELGLENRTVRAVLVKSVSDGVLDLGKVLPEDFNPRQVEVLDDVERRLMDDLVQGLFFQEIAEKDGISQLSVKKAVDSIISKIHAKNGNQATLFYLAYKQFLDSGKKR